MKTLFICLLFSASLAARAQSALPVNETGRVTFTEVVKTDSLKKALLYTNAKKWLSANGFQLTATPEDSAAGKLVGSQEFYLYARGYISKKIHGKIAYTATIEVKDNRYRYAFTDFMFAYYKEDRTYNMVPTGKEKPLEETKASGWQSLWEQHKKTTQTKINSSINSLKAAMPEVPKTKPETVVSKKVTSEDW